MGTLADVAVIIPAWQPEYRLPRLVADLQIAGFTTILVVDDGSTPDRNALFCSFARCPGITVLRHDRNRGKGHALKTAFAHVLSAHPGLLGVVTADADGQHLPGDIVRVAQRLRATACRPVLGVRGFDKDVPFRSRLGNTLTRHIFSLLTGTRLADTQTGLRGLPLGQLGALISLPGERYEYEMSMLAHLCMTAEPPEEVPIQTVYLDGNGSSHFKPLRDSLRVYTALLQVARAGWNAEARPRVKQDKPHPQPA